MNNIRTTLVIPIAISLTVKCISTVFGWLCSYINSSTFKSLLTKPNTLYVLTISAILSLSRCPKEESNK